MLVHELLGMPVRVSIEPVSVTCTRPGVRRRRANSIAPPAQPRRRGRIRLGSVRTSGPTLAFGAAASVPANSGQPRVPVSVHGRRRRTCGFVPVADLLPQPVIARFAEVTSPAGTGLNLNKVGMSGGFCHIVLRLAETCVSRPPFSAARTHPQKDHPNLGDSLSTSPKGCEPATTGCGPVGAARIAGRVER